MKIYLDIFFIVNLYVDYFILLTVKKFMNYQTKTSKLIFGALVGASLSIFSIFINNSFVNILFALLFAILICYISFYNKSKTALIKAYCCFVFLSFVFAGIVFILSYYSTKAYIIGTRPYFDISLLNLFIFTVLSYLGSELYRHIKGSDNSDLDFCKIVVEQNGSSIELFAKKDTGNSLKEPFSGLPVIVAEKESLKFENKNDNYRLIPFKSLGGNGLLPAFKPQKVYVKKTGKIVHCYLALYDGKLSIGSYNSLLNPEILI